MIRPVDKLKRLFRRVTHGRLEIAPNLFDGFSGPIATVSDKITRTRFERIDEMQSIPGWLSARERQMLGVDLDFCVVVESVAKNELSRRQRELLEVPHIDRDDIGEPQARDMPLQLPVV